MSTVDTENKHDNISSFLKYFKKKLAQNSFRWRSENDNIKAPIFIYTVRPVVHTNPSRKRSFSKTLFKRKNLCASLAFSCETKNGSFRRKLLKLLWAARENYHTPHVVIERLVKILLVDLLVSIKIVPSMRITITNETFTKANQSSVLKLGSNQISVNTDQNLISRNNINTKSMCMSWEEKNGSLNGRGPVIN